jgi:hypothetical protein
MTIEQTVEIPANRWVQMPASVPEGRVRIIIEFPVAENPTTEAKERARSALAALRGMYKDEAETAGSFLDRKYAEKTLEYKLDGYTLPDRSV